MGKKEEEVENWKRNGRRRMSMEKRRRTGKRRERKAKRRRKRGRTALDEHLAEKQYFLSKAAHLKNQHSNFMHSLH